MKYIARIFLITVCLLPMMGTAEPYRGFALSLFDPAQFPDNERSIHGARLTLIYGNNHDLYGADFGGLIWPFSVNRLTGELRGGQWGLANWVDGDMVGAQFGPVNRVGGQATGFQGGAFNISTRSGRFLAQWGFVNVTAHEHRGFQLGMLNHAGRITGAQVGLINHAVELDGVQVGLINVRQRPPMNMGEASPTVFPIVTWSF